VSVLNHLKVTTESASREFYKFTFDFTICP
jgi:hypothetical protein